GFKVPAESLWHLLCRCRTPICPRRWWRSSGRSTVPTTSAGSARNIRTGTSTELPEEKIDAVVTEGEADFRIVLTGADIWSLGGRSQINRQRPGERDCQQYNCGQGQVPDALPPA